MKKNDTFLGWCNICDDLLTSEKFPKHEVISMLVNHGFDVRVFHLWDEVPTLTKALLNNTIHDELLEDYDKEDLKIKINWINPNPSKIILFSPLITAQKALKMADKYHEKVHNKVISTLYQKSKSTDNKGKRFFKCVGNEYLKINDSQKI